MSCLYWSGLGLLIFLNTVFALYCFLLSPPLHLIYEPAPSAGKNSVYVPGKFTTYMFPAQALSLSNHLNLPLLIDSCSLGGGFAGFWYHLGVFQGLTEELQKFEYYCYSSGCLSLVLAFMNANFETTFGTCRDIQQSWRVGNISRYDMVDWFVDELVTTSPTAAKELDFLNKINVLVTTAKDGVQMRKAQDLQELKDLLIKTTWIPYVTGKGILKQTVNATTMFGAHHQEESFVDGGFSRNLHPACEKNINVPVTWKTTIHSLDPSFDRETALHFWRMGSTCHTRDHCNLL